MSWQLVLAQYWAVHTAGGSVCTARQRQHRQIVQAWCGIGCLYWREECLHSICSGNLCRVRRPGTAWAVECQREAMPVQLCSSSCRVQRPGQQSAAQHQGQHLKGASLQGREVSVSGCHACCRCTCYLRCATLSDRGYRLTSKRCLSGRPGLHQIGSQAQVSVPGAIPCGRVCFIVASGQAADLVRHMRLMSGMRAARGTPRPRGLHLAGAQAKASCPCLAPRPACPAPLPQQPAGQRRQGLSAEVDWPAAVEAETVMELGMQSTWRSGAAAASGCLLVTMPATKE